MIRKILALGLMVGLVTAVGCGARISPVEGVVTLDGKAVEGATVSFVPDDAKGKEANGLTDSSGHFTLKTGKKDGAQPGTYKVVVTKTEGIQGGSPETMKPGSPEYAKAMTKGVGKGGRGPGGMAGGSGPKSLLPGKYASAKDTPLTCTVPPTEKPVKFELTTTK
jgi:hypothetical protein